MISKRNLALLLLLACGCCSCAPALIHIGGPAADLASTQWAKGQGAVEKNPLIGASEGRLVGMKLMQSSMLLWTDHKLKPHPKAQKVFRVLAALGTWGIAAHNLRVGLAEQKARRQ